jgi:NADP-dependent 3-hydroxy acid dehydrogenase YdfG
VKALVTGASSGIGLALARRLAKRGFEVWLGARRKPALDALADEIRAAGGAATSVALDVSQPPRRP